MKMTWGRVSELEDRLTELEDRLTEILQSEKQREKRLEKLNRTSRRLYGTKSEV